MSWQPGDAIWSHAYGIRLEGKLPQPQKPAEGPKQDAHPPIELIEQHGLITGWVPIEHWRGAVWQKDEAEALAIERQMRIEGLRKNLTRAVLAGAVAWAALIWLAARWVVNRFGG